MKPIEFSGHALDRMPSRGATRDEVEAAVKNGERVAANLGRTAFRKNFQFEDTWKNRYYETKQVVAVVVEEADKFMVTTVFVFYFGGEQ